jgi:hypothetical protein
MIFSRTLILAHSLHAKVTLRPGEITVSLR